MEYINLSEVNNQHGQPPLISDQTIIYSVGGLKNC
jgi:hypothetical protein